MEVAGHDISLATRIITRRITRRVIPPQPRATKKLTKGSMTPPSQDLVVVYT
jgi:hypothetical protein